MHSAQIHDTMLAEWLESYNEEQAAFSSAAIAAEVKLRRAEVFTQHMPKPNPLLTAIAFEVLDLVGGLFGRYNGLMRRVRDVIFQSVYTDDLETVRDRAMERRIMGPARPHTARAGGRLEVADDEGELGRVLHALHAPFTLLAHRHGATPYYAGRL